MTFSKRVPLSAASALSNLLASFSRQGRGIFDRFMQPGPSGGDASAQPFVDAGIDLAVALLSVRGEASGVAIARDLLALYEEFSPEERLMFFQLIAERFGPDVAALDEAWETYRAEGAVRLPDVARAAEAPRQELFRRLNLAPGGTQALVRMRADLLDCRKAAPGSIDIVDADLFHLLQSWFNRGFLKMEAISWSSSAQLLERVIRYEAVHHIKDWVDLRDRLDPADRRCYAFFHPAMPDEPLIFVEVALTQGMPCSIQQLLASDRTPLAAADADTAVFYSISNCQAGLRGISFGHFLIKQVANDLKREMPNLGCFVTLSPIPGFRNWLGKHDAALAASVDPATWTTASATAALRDAVMNAAVSYFTEAKTAQGKPVDPVARFHLGNGARLERLNWQGDTSQGGLQQSAGLMVNYLYDLPKIEENHEAYAEHGRFAIGAPFKETMKRARQSNALRRDTARRPEHAKSL